MNPDNAQTVYDRLWAEACAAFETGSVRLDPFLLNRATDNRRGLTLMIRPDAAVITRSTEVIDRLREVAPEQHFYHSDELHITVLSLVGVIDNFERQNAPIAVYQSLFADLFPHVSPFRVHFRGLTASPDCVMLQGYVEDDALNHLRDRLRAALQGAGLGSTLDHRYRRAVAHCTFMRFQVQPPNLPGLVERLTALRGHDVGVFTANQVEFVKTDWFMSRDKVRQLGCYPLGCTAS